MSSYVEKEPAEAVQEEGKEDKEERIVRKSTEEKEKNNKVEIDQQGSSKTKADVGTSAAKASVPHKKTPPSNKEQVHVSAPAKLADKLTWTRRKVCAVMRPRWRRKNVADQSPSKSYFGEWPSLVNPPAPATSDAIERSAVGTSKPADSNDSDVVVTDMKVGKRTRGAGGSKNSARLDAGAGN